MNRSGIYKIQSISHPERCYIGSAIYVKSRKTLHLYELRRNIHHSRKLQRHFNKYGEQDLIFSIVEQFEFISKEHLLERENIYLIPLPYFNTLSVAGSPIGHKVSDVSRQKMREAKMGHISWNKGKKGLQTAWNKGTVGIMGGWNTGNKYMLGKHHSIETKEKIRLANTGKKLSDEIRRKISNAQIGRIPWNKGLKGVGGQIRGFKHSEETKQKIKDSWIIRKLNKYE